MKQVGEIVVQVFLAKYIPITLSVAGNTLFTFNNISVISASYKGEV